MVRRPGVVRSRRGRGQVRGGPGVRERRLRQSRKTLLAGFQQVCVLRALYTTTYHGVALALDIGQ